MEAGDEAGDDVAEEDDEKRESACDQYATIGFLSSFRWCVEADVDADEDDARRRRLREDGSVECDVEDVAEEVEVVEAVEMEEE